MTSSEGNLRAADLSQEKVARGLRSLYWQMERAINSDGYITTMRVRGPRDSEDDYLLVCKRNNEEGRPEVAFCSGSTLADVITAAGNKAKNGTLKWNPDKYQGSDNGG